jgi:hypothetical protein
MRSRSWYIAVAVASLAGGSLCWYFLWPYQVLHANEGFSRSLREMETHFLEPLSYLHGFVSETLLPRVSRIRRDEMSVTVTAAVLVGALLHAVLNRRLLRAGDGPLEHPALRAARWARLVAGGLFVALAVGLASSPGIVFTRERLLAKVWQGQAYVTGRSVDTLVKRLRRKIEADPASPQLIVTVWGDGYKFADV